jgi:hypothetical protein
MQFAMRAILLAACCSAVIGCGFGGDVSSTSTSKATLLTFGAFAAFNIVGDCSYQPSATTSYVVHGDYMASGSNKPSYYFFYTNSTGGHEFGSNHHGVKDFRTTATILNNNPLLYTADQDGNVYYVNTSGMIVSGYTSDQNLVVGQNASWQPVSGTNAGFLFAGADDRIYVQSLPAGTITRYSLFGEQQAQISVPTNVVNGLAAADSQGRLYLGVPTAGNAAQTTLTRYTVSGNTATVDPTFTRSNITGATFLLAGTDNHLFVQYANHLDALSIDGVKVATQTGGGWWPQLDGLLQIAVYVPASDSQACGNANNASSTTGKLIEVDQYKLNTP